MKWNNILLAVQHDETIFEYLVSEDGKWIHWNEMVPHFEYPVDSVLDYYTILVPNVDNTRTMYLIDAIAKQEKAVLLIGITFNFILCYHLNKNDVNLFILLYFRIYKLIFKSFVKIFFELICAQFN